MQPPTLRPTLVRLLSLPAVAVLLFVAGCAGSPTDPAHIAKRRTERAAAFASLSPAQQQLVDQGQIQVGMPEDAVYIAWGKPAQVLKRGDAAGEETTWLYTSSTTDQYLNWNYVEVRGRDGDRGLGRVMTTDYTFHDYVSARLVFRGGHVATWEMLPAPASNTVIGPGTGVVY